MALAAALNAGKYFKGNATVLPCVKQGKSLV